MAGVNQTDVWQAADAILVAGERPTIERVRHRIGRGSPNTITPLLDTWYRHLGARIADPLAFAQPANVPGPVQAAAEHFWNAASAEARRDFDTRLSEGLAAAHANVEIERARAQLAESTASEATQQLEAARVDNARLEQQLDQGRLDSAALAATLEEVKGQVAELKQAAAQARAEATAASERAERSVAEAIERLAGTERRAALEIDSERQARAAATKRSEALERRLETAQQELQVERLARREEHVRAAASAEAAGREAARMASELAQQVQFVEGLRGQLSDARREADVARAELTAAQRQAKSTRRGTAPRKSEK